MDHDALERLWLKSIYSQFLTEKIELIFSEIQLLLIYNIYNEIWSPERFRVKFSHRFSLW